MRLPLLLVLAATAFAAPADAHPAPARGDGVAFTLPEGWSREARKPGDPRGLAGRLVLTPGRRAPIPAGRLYRLPGRTSREAILAATPGEDAHAFDASWQVKPATLDGTPGEAAWLVRQAYDTGDAYLRADVVVARGGTGWRLVLDLAFSGDEHEAHAFLLDARRIIASWRWTAP